MSLKHVNMRKITIMLELEGIMLKPMTQEITKI